MKIIERIFDAATNETLDLEREMTSVEIAERKAAQAKSDAIEAAQAKAATARSALFLKLGITEEEAKLLLG